MRFLFGAPAIALVGLAIAGSLALAQSNPDAPKQIRAAAPAGTRSYAPGQWGLVEVNVANPGNTAATALTSLLFPGDPNLQYGREMWLPPRSRRISWYPVLVPPDVAVDASMLPYRALFIDRTGSNEAFIASHHGQMLSDGLLPLHRGRTTCWIGEAASSDDGAAAAAVADTLTAARIAAGLPRRLVQLRGLVLPTSTEMLQGIDHLALTSDRPATDAAGMQAIRGWVARGGRLWIMLDRVSPATVERLLGGACRIQEVDRVGLTEVRIEGIGEAAASSDPQPREFEAPVEMVRVLADDVEIMHTINGWPASFRHSLGEGEVWYTTVSAEAWTRPRTSADRLPRSADDDVYWLAGAPLNYLASALMGPIERNDVPSEIWEPFLAEQIGYEITSRRSVIAFLGAFCCGLLLGAVWLGRRGRLELMGWLAPLASVAAAGMLAAVGLQNTRAVPATVAEGQFVQTLSGSPDVQVSGLLMFYHQDTAAADLGSTNGGVFVPDMSGFGGEVRRMVWTDWDRWHWENLRLPRGVRVAPFRNDIRLDSPLKVTAAFGPEGLSGTVSGPAIDLTDVVLAAPSGGNLSVQLRPEGEFVSGPGHVLPQGKFISDRLVSDDQRRRQELYARALKSAGFEDRSGTELTLFGWADSLDLGFRHPEGVQQTGAALIAFPVQLTRTPPGTQVRIPAPLLSYRAVTAPDGTPLAGPLSNRTGEWSEYTGDSEFWLEFQLPPEVLPIELEGADLTIRITGATSRLEVLGLVQGEPETIRVWENPVGALRHGLSGAVLDHDAAGGVLLGFRIRGVVGAADAEPGALQSYWRIESLELEARGRTLAVDRKTKSSEMSNNER